MSFLCLSVQISSRSELKRGYEPLLWREIQYPSLVSQKKRKTIRVFRCADFLCSVQIPPEILLMCSPPFLWTAQNSNAEQHMWFFSGLSQNVHESPTWAGPSCLWSTQNLWAIEHIPFLFLLLKMCQLLRHELISWSLVCLIFFYRISMCAFLCSAQTQSKHYHVVSCFSGLINITKIESTPDS